MVEIRYGDQGDELRGIPPDTALKYTLELLDYTKGKESWAMSVDERIELMAKKKAQGNEYLKRQRLDKALVRYKEAFLIFRYMQQLTEQQVAHFLFSSQTMRNLSLKVGFQTRLSKCRHSK